MTKGTFESIEAKIRRDAEGTTFGGDFEWLCNRFLENAPRYRGQFDKVWLWKDWPDRWGTGAGIDIVARTRSGELWAIQAKADHPCRAIPKRKIDSFLSESNRPQFAYRLLMATTDDIGATARRTLHGQEKPVGLVLRGHFLTEEVEWPDQIGGSAPPLERWTAPPHRATAIKAVVKGFRNHDRGRLIMACGTSKTLTALWIAERLESSLTLVLVPSLSLVQQNLAEWGRHAAKDFDTLVVCSDESVVQSKADTAIQSTADNLHTAVRDFPGLSSEGPLMQFEIRCCDFRIRSNRMHCCVLLPLILAIVVSRTSAVAQDASARLLWALDLGSASYGGASIGDLAGDGHMLLVFGTFFTARFHRAISCRSGMLTARSEQMPRANMHTMMHIDSRFRAIHRNLATSVLSNHQLRVVFISHWALAHG